MGRSGSAPKRRKMDLPSSAKPDMDDLRSTTRWSELPPELVEDILMHIPTFKRVNYRRVSTKWDAILQKTGPGMTSTLLVGYYDLDKFHILCHKCPQKGWPKTINQKSFIPSMITQHTKRIILNLEIPEERTHDCRYTLQHRMGWTDKKKPLPKLVESHPQIQHIVLWNLFTDYRDLGHPDKEFNLMKYFGCSPSVGMGRVVTLRGLLMKCNEPDEEPTGVKYSMDKCGIRFGKIVMRCKDEGKTKPEEFYQPLLEQTEKALILMQYPTMERMMILVGLKTGLRKL